MHAHINRIYMSLCPSRETEQSYISMAQEEENSIKYSHLDLPHLEEEISYN